MFVVVFPSSIVCCVNFRVRFLLGGRHGDFKFLPPAGYSPCYEALLPKEKMYVEPVKEYKRDRSGVRELLGTTQFLSQASFIPTPVDTSQVCGAAGCCCSLMKPGISRVGPTAPSAAPLSL